MASHLNNPSNSSDMPCLRPRSTPATRTANRTKSKKLNGSLSIYHVIIDHWRQLCTNIYRLYQPDLCQRNSSKMVANSAILPHSFIHSILPRNTSAPSSLTIECRYSPD